MLLTTYLPEPSDPSLLDAHITSRPATPVGIVVMNLGTPDQPDAGSIRRYLKEFLSDPRVIEIPQPVWQLILRGAILPFRPRKLVEKYQMIWMPEGAPLLVYSQRQADGLQQRLDPTGQHVKVELAMRYGNPSVESAVDKLRAQGCERILVVPLYPQYAASTTATAVDAVTRYAAKMRNQPELRFIRSYCDHPAYIKPLAQSITTYWGAQGKPERLLLSFHGLPRRCAEKGDPYHRECMLTTAALRRELETTGVPVHAAFQSRFGAERWLEPYTEPLLRQWAKEGVKNVHVVCPGFLADCLETLEEIKLMCRDAFLEEGGQDFAYIPCLNDDAEWVDGLAHLVREHAAGWLA
ncbi:ferrochelatase [Paenalcaligenes sp. Me131]|uniref:ferrochelatase n=1 Tax=Paenalcaligenes sp. Me131 TaxID=3392636 RepID=UPI003D26D95C